MCECTLMRICARSCVPQVGGSPGRAQQLLRDEESLLWPVRASPFLKWTPDHLHLAVFERVFWLWTPHCQDH